MISLDKPYYCKDFWITPTNLQEEQLVLEFRKMLYASRTGQVRTTSLLKKLEDLNDKIDRPAPRK